MEELLTVAQTAEYLQVSVITVRRMVHRGDLAAVKLGPRRWRIRASAIEALLSPNGSAA